MSREGVCLEPNESRGKGVKGFPCLALLSLLIKDAFPMSAPLQLFLGWRCFAILVSPLNMYYIFSYITEMTHPPKH